MVKPNPRFVGQRVAIYRSSRYSGAIRVISGNTCFIEIKEQGIWARHWRDTHPVRDKNKPKPREWWLNVYPGGVGYCHPTKEMARPGLNGGVDPIHVREVLE